MALTPFDLAGYFVDDAKELVAARQKALKIHRNRDIDAAGDEVENPVRDILLRQAPPAVLCGARPHRRRQADDQPPT